MHHHTVRLDHRLPSQFTMLRVFRCLFSCSTNTSSTARYKLSQDFIACVFLARLHTKTINAMIDPILGVSSWRAPTCRRCPLSCPGQLSEASCCCAPRHPCTNMHAQQWSFGSAFGMIYYYCSSCNAAQPLDERLQYYIYIWKSCNIYM